MSPRFTKKGFLLKVTFVCIFILRVQSWRVGLESQYQSGDSKYERSLRSVLETYLAKRRSIDANTLARARYLYDVLTKKLLRHDEVIPKEAAEAARYVKDDMEEVVEHELQDSLSKKESALLERPFVQHRGENDFLVLHPGVKDPFVTVVPNDIYYNVEKRCVNWLDDCNARGIRNRLLQKVRSPYR